MAPQVYNTGSTLSDMLIDVCIVSVWHTRGYVRDFIAKFGNVESRRDVIASIELPQDADLHVTVYCCASLFSIDFLAC